MRHRLISAGTLYLSITLVGMTSDLAAKAQNVSDQAGQISQTEALLVAGKVAEAEKTAKLSVAQNPHLSVAYVLLGRVYDAEKRPEDAQSAYQQAIVQFQKANEQGDGSAELFLNMGSAYSHLQEFDKAKECYFQSIQLNSDNAAPYVRIGADYLTQNIPPQAWPGSPAPSSSTLRIRKVFPASHRLRKREVLRTAQHLPGKICGAAAR